MTNIGPKKLELLQFHFHTPSEHSLNSKRFAMEAHLVHREVGTDELTVLGIMMVRGKGAPSNPCLRKALDLAPAPGGKVHSSNNQACFASTQGGQ
jgi:carbonic anhydrase